MVLGTIHYEQKQENTVQITIKKKLKNDG